MEGWEFGAGIGGVIKGEGEAERSQQEQGDGL